MSEEVLKVLANGNNQTILSLLKVEPTYPRRIGDLLSLSETEVARRLKHMEQLGLVESEWKYIGKNVKLYKLVPDEISLRFTPEGLALEMHEADGRGPAPSLFNPLRMRVPRPVEFVGREKEMAELDGPEPVVIVEGMPGIGKTSLVASYATVRGQTRPVFWHSFRGVESINWLANRLAVFAAQGGDRELLDAIEQGAEVADLRELMLDVVASPEGTIILDDMHTLEDEAVRNFVVDAIGRTTQGKLVVTSRERPRYNPSLEHVRLLRLEGLSDEDVGAFLQHKGLDLDPADLPQFRAEVGGHPLALNLLLETAKELDVPVKELLDRIPERDLETYLLQEVVETLSAEERRVLGHASIFRTVFTADDLAALSQASPESALYKLRLRLLLQDYDGIYGLHEVVRNFFYTHLSDRKQLHERAARHFLATGSIEGRLEALHHLLEADQRDQVLHLLEENLDLREFDFIDAGYQNLYLTILDLFDEKEVDDERKWALMEDERGDIWYHRGELRTALEHYDAAAAYFDGSDEAEHAADLCWKRALVHSKLGDEKKARTLCDAGLEAAPDEGIHRERLMELSASLGKP